MRAIVLRTLGNPDVLQMEDVPDPAPGAGEAVVRLRAAALNHRDVWIRKGQYAGIKTPIILGSDGAGEVAAVGAGVDPTWVGKPVVINPHNFRNPAFDEIKVALAGPGSNILIIRPIWISM